MWRIFKNSLRRQIIFGVTFIHAVLILFFGFDMVARQSRFMHTESIETANGLAQALATNSAIWSLARDYSGLQEVVLAQMKYPNVKMAMVYGLDGKIWAHSDADKIGLFINATKNPRLVSAMDQGFVIEDKGKNSVSSIKNIESNGVVLGKVWIVLSEERLQQSLKKNIFDGFLYFLIAISIGAVFATVVTNAMSQRLKKLVDVAERVKRGEGEVRVRLPAGDELGQLGEAFDSMLESLEQKQKVLEKSQAEAKAANQAKSDFLANMSHEIRTPINTMVGMADVLADTAMSDEQRKFIMIFQRAGESLTGLVNDILDLSKIEAGELQIKKEVFSLEELFSELSMLYMEIALKKKLALKVEIKNDVPLFVVGDKDRIRQVLMNLISNAIKFTEKGSIQVVAERIALNDRIHTIRFIVEDSGIGIPEDKSDVIFERFQQIDSSRSRKVGGTGLGLAISKKLVELMDGHIDFESNYTCGSKFFFTLHLTEIFESERPALNQRLGAKGTESPFSSDEKSILLVDDSDDNRLLVKAYLKDLPVRFIECKNGQEAVEIFRQKQFDLVLLDLQMPILDGYESIRLMRKWEIENQRNSTPVFALSADSIPELIQRALSSGCDDHISKPVRKKQLVAIIERTLFLKSTNLA